VGRSNCDVQRRPCHGEQRLCTTVSMLERLDWFSNPLGKQAEVSKMLDMQWWGLIEEPNSPLSYRILIWKKNEDLHFCVDCRKMNDVTKKGCFPLPRIDDILDMLAEAKWFCTLALKSGYWQVVLHPNDKEQSSRWVKSCGNSQSQPLASATLQWCLSS
jgi:hypothetical protein